mgnify:CR=1 FL=1
MEGISSGRNSRESERGEAARKNSRRSEGERERGDCDKL